MEYSAYKIIGIIIKNEKKRLFLMCFIGYYTNIRDEWLNMYEGIWKIGNNYEQFGWGKVERIFYINKQRGTKISSIVLLYSK